MCGTNHLFGRRYGTNIYSLASMRTPIAVLLFLLSPAVRYAQMRPPAARPIALTRAAIIDVRTGQLSPDMTILVTGDRISAVGKTGNVRVPGDVEVMMLPDST
jgi:hypothetical protein